MNVRRGMRWGIPLLALLAHGVTPVPGSALPLFTRQGSVACAGCHSASPRLNPAGMRFAQDGYRSQDTREPLHGNLGNVPASLSGGLAVSLSRRDTSAAVTGAGGGADAGDLRLGRLTLHSAGVFLVRVSWDCTADLDPGADTPQATSAFVQFDDILGRGGLNARVGRFDAELPWLSSRRRTTVHDYLSPVTLPARGIELNGRHTAWTYGVGAVRSRRAHVQNGLLARAPGGLEDTFLWAIRDIRSQQVGARMLFDRQDSNLPTLAWLQHLQAQCSALLECGRVTVVPAWTLDRFDDRPAAGIHLRHQYMLLEAFTTLGSGGRWVPTVRLEHDYRTRTVLTREEDHDRETLNLAYHFNTNASATLEWARAGDNHDGPKVATFDAGVQVTY